MILLLYDIIRLVETTGTKTKRQNQVVHYLLFFGANKTLKTQMQCREQHNLIIIERFSLDWLESCLA